MSSAALRTETPLDFGPSGLPSPPSVLDFVERSGLRSIVLGTSKDPNRKVTLLLVSPDTGRPVFAIKAPTTDAAASVVEAEASVLLELSKLRLGPAGSAVPRFVEWVDFQGRPAMVTAALEGTPLRTMYLRWGHTADASRVAADFAAVGAWLADFQGSTAREPRAIDMDAGVFTRLRSRFSGHPQLDGNLDRLGEILSRLDDYRVPRTALQGDLWFGNVLLDDERVSGVVDWEAGSTSGEPVRDLVRFALTYALYLDWRTRPGRRVAGHSRLRADRWGAGVEYAFSGSGWFPTLFRRFIADGLTRLGTSSAAWRDAALAGLAEIASLSDDPAFGQLHLELFGRLAADRREGESP